MFGGQDKDKKKGAKQSSSSGVGTERRQRQLQQIRSKAHKEVLKHFRDANEDEGTAEGASPTGPAGSLEDLTLITKDTPPQLISPSVLPQCVQILQAQETRDAVYHALFVVRKLLCVSQNPPNDLVVQAGLVPILVHMMTIQDAEMQFEAAWAITNLAAGEPVYARVVVEANCIPPLVALLHSNDDGCRDQAAWALGNLSGDCAEFRDLILQAGGLEGLVHAITVPDAKAVSIKDCTWAISNICRKKPAAPLETLLPSLQILRHLLHHEDDSVVSDAAWSVSYISDGPSERTQAVIDAGVMPRIVELLSYPSTELRMPAIRTVGNCAASVESHTQLVINLGALQPMTLLLGDSKRAIRKETCWTLSNITAGTVEQARAAVQSNIFVPVIQQALVAPELDVRREACYCVSNLVSLRIPDFNQYLLEMGVLPPLVECLRVGDTKIITVALEALDGLLEYGAALSTIHNSPTNAVADDLHSCGAVDAFEDLQNSRDQNIYEMCISILDTYFETGDGEPEVQGFGGADMVNFQDPNQMGGGGNFNF